MKLNQLLASSAIAAIAASGAFAQTTPEAAPAGDQAVAAAPLSIDEMTVDQFIGLPVQSADDEDVGEIDYVIASGEAEASAVIGIGGFLGLGEYTVALPLSAFDYDAETNRLVVNWTEDELRAQPEFDESNAESLPGDMMIAELMADGNASMQASAGAEAQPVEGAGEQLEQTAENAEDAVQNTAEDAEMAAENAGEAIENTAEDAVVAADNAAEDAGQAIEENAEETGEALENTANDVEMAADEATDGDGELIEGETDMAEAGTNEATVPATDQAMVDDFPMTIEEMTVGEFIGLNVLSADGEDVGEIDYVIAGTEEPAAVIGIGGFLGLGEYTVALPVSAFDYDAEERTLVVNWTEEELRAQPEFDESEAESLPDDMLMSDLMMHGGSDTGTTNTDAAVTEPTTGG
ncbi:hypothetical protein HKCCE2091_12005 [Rhodobacterales bacterium HKCCE2091]|nr:hypothetical protein [Rhodobacterales bacterium HKCCE2091]